MKKIFKIIITLILVGTIAIPKFKADNDVFSQLNSEEEFYGQAYISKITENGYDNLIDEGYQTYRSDLVAESDTIFNIGSISKIFTTVGILKLEESGKLSTDDTLGKYFENVPSEFQGITIEMLLTHSSGITIEEEDELTLTKEEAIERIFSSELSFEPGENYYYSNSGFTVLGAIIEEASSKTYDEYIQEVIIDPLKLENTGFPQSEKFSGENAVIGYVGEQSYGNVTEGPWGWESKGYTDVLSTSEDLTIFITALVNGQLLNKTEMEKMTNPYFQVNSGEYRGLGIAIRYDSENKPIYYHSGAWYGGNSYFSYRVSDQIGLVTMTNDIDFGYYYPASHAATEFLNANAVGTLDDREVLSSYELPVESDNDEPEVETLQKGFSVDQLFDSTTENNIWSENKKLIILLAGIIILIVIVLILHNLRKKLKQ